MIVNESAIGSDEREFTRRCVPAAERRRATAWDLHPGLSRDVPPALRIALRRACPGR